MYTKDVDLNQYFEFIQKTLLMVERKSIVSNETDQIKRNSLALCNKNGQHIDTKYGTDHIL